MKKNLVLIHLESLNMLNFRMNPWLFPTLGLIEKKCITFDHYYSTATSTLMVISDLLYGGMEQHERCTSLRSIPERYAYSVSLLDDLREDGYYTGIYNYPFGGGDWESANDRHVAGFLQTIRIMQNYQQYIEVCEQTMEHSPFAMLACNVISNVSLNQYTDPGKHGVETDYWESGYYAMDRSVADIMHLLRKKGKMEDTIIIFYGDHGDDFWSHGGHGGLSHAIEPYAPLIHAPLFVWDGKERREAEHHAQLIQTSDLRGMIAAMLAGDAIIPSAKRKYCFSRNSYARQSIRRNQRNKSYSITDGRYLLLVSCRGLEMYDMLRDWICQNNLLRIFEYHGSFLKKKDNSVSDCQVHFSSFFNGRYQRMIRRKFYDMIPILRANVLRMYISAGLDERSMLQEMDFSSIRYP